MVLESWLFGALGWLIAYCSSWLNDCCTDFANVRPNVRWKQEENLSLRSHKYYYIFRNVKWYKFCHLQEDFW